MQKIYRILDANLNRALEGLRVVEEVARFILEDKTLSVKIKKLRAQLAEVAEKIPEAARGILARHSAADVGWKVYPKSEAARADVMAIFKANAKRAIEALRVLEEFSKLVAPALGRSFKDLRFASYDLEKEVYLEISAYFKKEKLAFGLYAVIDPSFFGKKMFAVAEKALKCGVKIFQYRDKAASPGVFLRNAKKFKRLAQKYRAVFVINDRVAIAKQVDADGVHLGQEDLAPRRARQILGEDKIIGLSTHSLKQAGAAQKSMVDYISCGPVFKTRTKPWRRAVGLSLLRQVVKMSKKPVVAIGGITLKNVRAVYQTGVRRIAVINALPEFCR